MQVQSPASLSGLRSWHGCGCGVGRQLQLRFDRSLGTSICCRSLGSEWKFLAPKLNFTFKGKKGRASKMQDGSQLVSVGLSRQLPGFRVSFSSHAPSGVLNGTGSLTVPRKTQPRPSGAWKILRCWKDGARLPLQGPRPVLPSQQMGTNLMLNTMY